MLYRSVHFPVSFMSRFKEQTDVKRPKQRQETINVKNSYVSVE